jgi:hypothetical protein
MNTLIIPELLTKNIDREEEEEQQLLFDEQLMLDREFYDRDSQY